MNTKNIHRLGLVFTIIMLSFSVQSLPQTQNHLILKKNGYHNRLHYFTGDSISLIRIGNTYIENGRIQGIGIDEIILGGKIIQLSEISSIVYTRKSFNYAAGGQMILMASPLYLLLGAVNALIQGIRPLWSSGNLIVAGTIAATGILVSTLQFRKFDLGKKFQLRIVQSDPMLNH